MFTLGFYSSCNIVPLRFLIPLLFVLVIIATSCSEDVLFFEERTLDQQGWQYDKPISFDIEIEDTTTVYDMQLYVDHKTDYNFENIYMMVDTDFPTIETKQERINIDFADKKGDWVGKCRGDNCSLQVFMLDNFRFPEKGKYSFTFTQYTRQPNLKGVSKLALKIKPHAKSN